ncbi:MAG: hypothetical protein ABIV92_02135 [Thermoflexales bacterium]
MDPITLIVTAMVAGAAEAAKPSAAQAIKDGYAGLKALILRKLGGAPNAADANDAIEKVEKKPENAPRQEVLQDELKIAGVDEDAEILKLATSLLEAAKGSGASTMTYTATLTGSGAIAQGTRAMAAGAGGIVIGGTNTGSVNTGNQFNARNIMAKDFVLGSKTEIYNHGGASAADATALISDDGKRLAKLLNDYFSEPDLEGLCFEMDVDWENLPGAIKEAKARAMVAHVERRDELAKLQMLVRVARPNLKGQM